MFPSPWPAPTNEHFWTQRAPQRLLRAKRTAEGDRLTWRVESLAAAEAHEPFVFHTPRDDGMTVAVFDAQHDRELWTTEVHGPSGEQRCSPRLEGEHLMLDCVTLLADGQRLVHRALLSFTTGEVLRRETLATNLHDAINARVRTITQRLSRTVPDREACSATGIRAPSVWLETPHSEVELGWNVYGASTLIVKRRDGTVVTRFVSTSSRNTRRFLADVIDARYFLMWEVPSHEPTDHVDAPRIIDLETGRSVLHSAW
ncbi:MAG: hypothetical protein ACO1OB_25800 [Archangium sp.]